LRLLTTLATRLGTLSDLSMAAASAKSMAEFWRLTLQVLEANEKDIMLCLIYTVERTHEGYDGSRATLESLLSRGIRLQGTIGIPEGHPVAIQLYRNDASLEGLIPYFAQALNCGKPVVLTSDDATLPQELLRDIQSKSFGEPCRALVISPLRHINSSNPTPGFLVTSGDPRTATDQKYLEFIEAIATLVGATVSSTSTFESELETAVQAQLKRSWEMDNTQLVLQKLEKLKRHFSEMSCAGIFIMDRNGRFLCRNKGWFNLMGIQKDGTEPWHIKDVWEQALDPECIQEDGIPSWQRILQAHEPTRMELKLKKSWEPNDEPCYSPDNHHEHRAWVLADTFPGLGADGEVQQILGFLTDISALKWVNMIQSKQATEALEAKRRLEQFMDTTNHELRNPLGAICLAGDEIVGCVMKVLDVYRDPDTVPDSIRQFLNNMIENGRTVVQCAKHLKRIVDDVLTASKIDSRLIEVCPVPTDPQQEILSCIKIFEGDAFDANVDIVFKTTQRFDMNERHLYMFDPTRFIQVFINLFTNAIKFTRFEQTRIITVKLDITKDDPSKEESCMTYLPPDESLQDPTRGEEWGVGPQMYIVVKVRDTGKGLSDEEKAHLFARFKQGPRTYVRYGGSGLGLFISRQLVHLQGGAIGFTSEAGVGSTFAFYIKTRASMSRKTSAARQSRDLKTAKAQISDIDLPSTQQWFAGSSGRSSTAGGSGTPSSPDSGIPSPSVEESSPLELRSMSSLTVLIVEDNLINQKALARQLQRMGAEVVVANHGEEALEQIKKTKWTRGSGSSKDISVVLLDWEMPVMDGLLCAKRIRELQKDGELGIIGHLPIIGVTANARQAQLQEAIDAGMVCEFCAIQLVINTDHQSRTTSCPNLSVSRI
jgi:signal transduction histidine kinase/CheY-like chemotaxis protein